MAKTKDTDYLAISARIRVLENRLLTRERLEQLVEAREDAEAARLLADCGYAEPAALTPGGVEETLGRAQADLFADLSKALGEENHVLPVFRIKYDYHNAKALVKGEAVGADTRHLLVSGGRFDPETLAENYRVDDLSAYPEPFRRAVEEARALLADSHDPQLADFLLDRACYGEISREAQASGNDFLAGYVKILIDSLNLRAYVRATRAGQGRPLLERALLPGGGVAPQAILDAKADSLARLFEPAGLGEAAQRGASLLAGSGDMTAFERACDDAVTRYVRRARRVPFGLEPVVGYLYARSAERTAIRTVFSGRMAGLDRDTIRERLREAYV